MAGLFVLGVLHAYLLWYNDFLVSLAVCGSVAFLFRHVSAQKMLIAGVAIMAFVTIVSIHAAWTMPSWTAAQDAAAHQQWAPTADVLHDEIEAYRGGWWAQMRHRIPTALARETVGFASRAFWQMTGLMLIGMSLFRLGILSALWPTNFYAAVALCGFAIGIPLVLYGVRENFASGWELREAIIVDGTVN